MNTKIPYASQTKSISNEKINPWKYLQPWRKEVRIQRIPARRFISIVTEQRVSEMRIFTFETAVKNWEEFINFRISPESKSSHFVKDDFLWEPWNISFFKWIEYWKNRSDLTKLTNGNYLAKGCTWEGISLLCL